MLLRFEKGDSHSTMILETYIEYLLLIIDYCYTQNLTVCQLIGHAEYMIPHFMCSLVHVGSMKTIKEQISAIEGESQEELTPDEQGPCPGAAKHQQARGRAGRGLLALGERALLGGLLAVGEQAALMGLLADGEQACTPGAAHPRRAWSPRGCSPLTSWPSLRGHSPPTTSTTTHSFSSAMDPPSLILLHVLSTVHFTSQLDLDLRVPLSLDRHSGLTTSIPPVM